MSVSTVSRTLRSPFDPPLPAPGRVQRWGRLYGSGVGLVVAGAARRHEGATVVLAPDQSTAERLEQSLRFYVDGGLPLLILPDRELMLRFNGTRELDSYKNASLIDRYHRNRRDLLRTYSLALSQQILHHPRFGDLTLHAVVEWTDADSNVSISDGVYPFTYNKNLYGIQLEWTW